MDTYQKIQEIGTIATLVGVLFMIFKSVVFPQKKEEKDNALLAEKVERMSADLVNLRDNHVHTLDTKLEETNKALQMMAIQMTRLNTIVEERIPPIKRIE